MSSLYALCGHAVMYYDTEALSKPDIFLPHHLHSHHLTYRPDAEGKAIVPGGGVLAGSKKWFERKWSLAMLVVLDR